MVHTDRRAPRRFRSLAILACAAAFTFIGLQRASAQQEQPADAKPYLGVIVEQPEEGRGVVIVDVDQRGPAFLAGIKANDVIESINGRAIASTNDMAAALKGQGIGSVLKFVVRRGDRSVNANVKLIAAPSGAAAGGVAVEKVDIPKSESGDDDAPTPLPDPDALGPAPSNAGPERPYLGITVIPHSKGGAAISSIRKDSPAARVGFPLGAVIVRVNDTPVNTPDDLINFIASMEPGATVEISYVHQDRPYRKQVKLSAIGGSAAPSYSTPEEVSPPSTPPRPVDSEPRTNRPLLNGVERILGNTAASKGNAALQQEVDELKAKVAELEERLAKLEQELAALKAPPAEEVEPTPEEPPAL
jgi:predicted metalloprotease with PDZ domain